MPSIIRVPHQYAVNTKRVYVQDALATIGEECIALTMYHVAIDLDTQPRCSNCWDDIYQQSTKADCAVCFGTTFYGGVKKANRVFAVFNDKPNTEKFDKRGESDWATHSIQIEASPTLKQNDILIRVKEWQTKLMDGVSIVYPKEYGSRYSLGAVQEVTLRTGARYGQTKYDKLGQTTKAMQLSDQHPIYHWICPEPILRSDEIIVWP